MDICPRFLNGVKKDVAKSVNQDVTQIVEDIRGLVLNNYDVLFLFKWVNRDRVAHSLAKWALCCRTNGVNSFALDLSKRILPFRVPQYGLV